MQERSTRGGGSPQRRRHGRWARLLAASAAALLGACALPGSGPVVTGDGPAGLPPAVLTALQAAGVPADALAAVALPLGDAAGAGSAGSSRPWRWRAEVPMQPGSLMKLVTSIVALDRLGPGHRGYTELRSAAPLVGDVLEGDLALVGGADPDLGVPPFWALLLDLRLQGVATIRGDLVVDRTRFRPARADLGVPPFDEAPEFAYNVIPDALQLAGNLLPLDLKAGAGGVTATTVPPLPGIEITSRMTLTDTPCADWDDDWRPAQVSQRGADTRIELQGGFPRDCARRTALQLIDRLELAERLFRTLWAQLGGRWEGRAREAAAAPGARVLARHDARPWGEVLRHMNKQSDNAEARLLFLELGVPAMAAEPQLDTAVLAARAVRGWLAEHAISDQGLVLDNGSGLSRSERVTPWQLAAMLQVAYAGRHASELLASLPVAGVDGTMGKRLQGSPAAGWARLKTGTLANVAALAGYVYDDRGRPWAVALMINHAHADRAQGALDAWVDDLARHGLPQRRRGREFFELAPSPRGRGPG